MEQEYAILALVIIITVGTTATEMFKHYVKSKTSNLADNHSHELDALRQQNNELKQRIATLEKIVTEPEYDLKQQINSL
ncbi:MULTISPECIES: hypothetical protein [Shewanella]|uniref:Phage shock protein B n=1 Tax=Shewanella japonica TaxID=93973 RepID=A0ABN4YL69_9GAMM|nr:MULTISPECIES: hypothetical protein [Shewanella]ARD24343.1 hypothetical protein SJ2017_4116 [Shewanella japonica]KPZ71299.1 Phage shock protein B [Shewanella sp. P1-14-1]